MSIDGQKIRLISEGKANIQYKGKNTLIPLYFLSYIFLIYGRKNKSSQRHEVPEALRRNMSGAEPSRGEEAYSGGMTAYFRGVPPRVCMCALWGYIKKKKSRAGRPAEGMRPWKAAPDFQEASFPCPSLVDERILCGTGKSRFCRENVESLLPGSKNAFAARTKRVTCMGENHASDIQ